MLNIGDASGNAAGDYFGIAIGDDGSGYNKELYIIAQVQTLHLTQIKQLLQMLGIMLYLHIQALL